MLGSAIRTRERLRDQPIIADGNDRFTIRAYGRRADRSRSRPTGDPKLTAVAILSQPDSLSSAEAIRVAIILPTHRHSGLLPEALDTALSQQTDFPYAVVIVNDGCPFPETDRVCREFAAAHSGRIYYLHTRNNGLSAARNTGIDFALAAFPALDAVYFLDSDNRRRACSPQAAGWCSKRRCARIS